MNTPGESTMQSFAAPLDGPHYCPHGNEVALFTHAYRNQLPLMLKGPTGCGKTRFVRHMAHRLGRPLITVACHDDLTAADLIGRHLLNTEGTYWHDGPLTRAARSGAICYLDEVIEARKDTTVVLHPLTDDRRILPIDRTGEVLELPPQFMLVVSYNPGYQSLTKNLKPSTRQRFIGLSFSFPSPEVECKIVMRESGVDQSVAQQLVDLATALRRLGGCDLEEVASTRLLIHAACLIQSGCDLRQACDAAMIETLSDDVDQQDALREVVNACLLD